MEKYMIEKYQYNTKYKNEIPDLNKLNDNINLIEQMKIYKELKEFSKE